MMQLVSSLAIIVFIAMLPCCRSEVKGNILAVYDLCLFRDLAASPVIPVQATLVAHAGGAVRGIIYTNSREALDENYAKGYRLFELDFHWTSDNRLVLVHDWKETSIQLGTWEHVLSYYDFIRMARKDGLHQMAFEDLHEWLKIHPDALVVTDTKSSNLRLLEYLQKNSNDMLPRIIIQIYRLSELRKARSLAPRAVWLTVYKSSYPGWSLSMMHGVDAFVIPITKYNKYYNPALMEKVRFYVHSVPVDRVEEISRHLPGIYGYYVD
jgi:glycerophosphoryl diester phosphodiesterase